MEQITKELLKRLVSPKLTNDESKILRATKIQLPEHSGGRLSPTQIVMYIRCGFQYYQRYVLGKKIPPAATLVEGSTHHTAFEANNKHKMKTGRDYTPKRQAEFFCDTFNVNKKEIPRGGWEGETANGILKRGKNIQTNYMKNVAIHLLPLKSEKVYEMRIGDVDVVGYMDVAAEIKGGLIKSTKTETEFFGVAARDINSAKRKIAALDYKIVGKKRQKNEIENSVALGFYGWGLVETLPQLVMGKKMPFVGFCNLLKTSTGRIVTQSTLLTPQRIEWLRRIVLSVADSISRGAFPLCDASTNYLCSPKYCGYWKQCKGKVWKG